TPREGWRLRHFTAEELVDPTVSGDEADPNGNGLPNWAEFAFDADPNSFGEDALPMLADGPDAGTVVFSFIRRSGAAGTPAHSVWEEIGYRVQESDDLTEWRDLAPLESPEEARILPMGGGLTERVEIVLSTGRFPQKRFL